MLLYIKLLNDCKESELYMHFSDRIHGIMETVSSEISDLLT